MSTPEQVESLHLERLNDETDEEYYIPEKYQLGLLTDYLQTHRFEYVTEGRVFCYPIDLLCVREETTVAIEMKSGKVSRGIEQAWRNSDFVDFSYLAVWEEQVTDELIEEVTELPIGLFAVGAQVEQVSSPQITPKQLCSKDNIINTVKENVRDDAAVQRPE